MNIDIILRFFGSMRGGCLYYELRRETRKSNT